MTNNNNNNNNGRNQMTFDHFDTQVSHEETQYYRDWLAWGEYVKSHGAELDEVDMQCDRAEAEAVAAGYPPTL